MMSLPPTPKRGSPTNSMRHVSGTWGGQQTRVARVQKRRRSSDWRFARPCLQPRVARDEGERDVAGPEADGERAHAARGARVRVGADDDLPGLGPLAGKLSLHEWRKEGGAWQPAPRPEQRTERTHVHDGRVWAPRRQGEATKGGDIPQVAQQTPVLPTSPIIVNLGFGRKLIRQLDQRGRLRLVVIAGVDCVVDREPDALLIRDRRTPNLGPHVRDADQRELVRHRPVDPHADGLAGRNIGARQPDGVVRDDLLDTEVASRPDVTRRKQSAFINALGTHIFIGRVAGSAAISATNTANAE